ncbi:hypothetical protein R6242_20440 [Iodobacter sp. CM08]|uniref:hypothetical protein n=1 Tax=Iodobacter sp. CM08 TaxID=3085902 RepID=UPI0029813267|nr:hypothetical protein [Iodobacter sp. CM08]MDW5418945.1 hypothetical protein [Iodobacter sp. CM08]
MPNQTLTSPSGKELILVANKTTTSKENDEIKKILVARETIEVIVGENIGVNPGSIFGHAAIDIDGVVYSRAHEKYAVIDKNKYINGGESLPNGQVSTGQRGSRNSVGVILRLSQREKAVVLTELKRRVAADSQARQKNSKDTDYSIFSNSCSSNVADVLELVGVLAHDPRFLPFPVSPKEQLAVLKRSNRVVKTIEYPKVSQ